ncbi:hypothetical protein [Nocardioides cynanchi]|uniref:hypothetical protein n=1 Tax=Nocardioides cynanchi TaxID=2558918 RepID=UPI0012464866|nr:hypothetical protein [Nocardioides cynanchi]
MHITTKRPLAALLTGLLLLALTTLSLQSPTHAAVSRPGASKLSGFFGGRLINPATGNPVKGVTVKVFEINTDNLLGQDKSGSAGYYRIDGLSAADEELDVRVNGSAVRYETGWVGCNHNVVPSWGDACSFPQGRQSPIKVQHL